MEQYWQLATKLSFLMFGVSISMPVTQKDTLKSRMKESLFHNSSPITIKKNPAEYLELTSFLTHTQTNYTPCINLALVFHLWVRCASGLPDIVIALITISFFQCWIWKRSFPPGWRGEFCRVLLGLHLHLAPATVVLLSCCWPTPPNPLRHHSVTAFIPSPSVTSPSYCPAATIYLFEALMRVSGSNQERIRH